MKRITRYIASPLFLLCAGILAVSAADKTHFGGPNGGRFLEKTEPKAEFVFEKDHSATIYFYNAESKSAAPTTQLVTVIADAPGKRQTVEFERKGNVLVSKSKLPEGDGYNLVVQFRRTPDSKPQNFRFKLETHICDGCKRAEYSCTCDE